MNDLSLTNPGFDISVTRCVENLLSSKTNVKQVDA
jgi:hypothetical protein